MKNIPWLGLAIVLAPLALIVTLLVAAGPTDAQILDFSITRGTTNGQEVYTFGDGWALFLLAIAWRVAFGGKRKL